MSKNSKQVHFSKILLSDGWAENVVLEIGEKGKILRVARDAPPSARSVKGVAIPGMTNAHSHAFQRAIVGRSERRGSPSDDFWTWRQAMYGAVRKIGPEEMDAIASQAYVEMVKAGYTGVCEFHYLHHQADGSPYENPAEMAEAVMRAAARSGIEMRLFPVLYMRSNFGEKDLAPEQKPFANTPETLAKILEKLKGRCPLGMALHSLRAVPEEVVVKARKMAPKLPIHIHIAEQAKEVADCLRRHGKRPVEWLLANVDLDRNWHLVHGTNVNVMELDGLVASKANVVLCPTTEANLGDGLFPFVQYRERKGGFAIGSDSQVSIDPREELRLLEYGQRLETKKRAIAGTNPGAALWTEAVQGGAAAIGHQAGIKAGSRANIVVLDPGAPMFAGLEGDQILDAFVFAGQPNPVKDVMIGGRWVVREGYHPREDNIKKRYVAALSKLF